jgi:hypothetical protein
MNPLHLAPDYTKHIDQVVEHVLKGSDSDHSSAPTVERQSNRRARLFYYSRLRAKAWF